MAFLGKNYTFEKDENFDAFLKSVGLPDEKIKAYISLKGSLKLVQNGDSYAYISTNINGSKEVTFKSGVEFDDTIGPEKHPIKSKYVVDGNTITQTITSEKGTAIIKREYSANELVVTITTNKWDGVAKRYYKA